MGWWKNVKRPNPDAARIRREIISRNARGEIPRSTEPYTTVILTKGGEQRSILWQDAKGPGGLFIAAGQDITALHHAEEELERRGRDFRAIFDGASDGILILNTDWVYVDANAAAARIYGVPVKEIIGKSQGTLLHQ